MTSKTRVGWILRIAGIALLVMIGAGSLLAQIEVGRVTGTVTDQTGAVVNGAKVTLTNNDTGVTATEMTADGVYAFTAVKPGVYTLRVESTGFSTHVTNNVTVHVQQVNTVDTQLIPGKVTEQVVVNTTAPLLQAETAEIGTTINSITVDDMPLNGRTWSSLAMLAPGVTTTQPGYSNEGGNGTPSSTFGSINGTSLYTNDFRLNGVGDMLEFYNGAPAIQPPPEAIEEFKLENGDYSAELGHSIGGVVNAVLKSGTNKLHGDLFDYFRNDALDAKDYFTTSQPIGELRQNQFGGTVGGPVYIPHVYDGRNKTFFFFDYQEKKAISPVQNFTVVPTNNMVTSGFTNLQDLIAGATGVNTDKLGRMFPTGTVLDPATTRQVATGAVDPISGLTNTTGAPISVRDPFFNGNSVAGITNFTTPGNEANLNLLPANRLDPNALKILNLFGSIPASAVNQNPQDLYSGNYRKNFKANETDRQYDVRIDHNFSDRDTITGFYSRSKTDAFTPPFLPGDLDGGYYYNGDVLNPHQSVNGSYTHVFSPNLTNEFRLGYGKQDRFIQAPEANTLGIPAQYGIQGIPQLAGNGGLPDIGISPFAGIGPSPYTPTIIHAHNLQIIDNVTKIYGRHVFKMGVDVNDIEGDIVQPPWGRGNFDFNGEYTDVPNQNNGTTGIAQFLLTPIASSVGGTDFVGGTDSVLASSANGTQDHRWYIGSYFQDSYKVTPTLTLDLGLRWDLFTPYAEINGHQANFVPNGQNGPGGAYYVPETSCGYQSNPAFEQLLATDGIKTVCSSGLGTGSYGKKNFAPRVGFAKRITPRDVLRAGFGIAYGSLDSIGYGPNIGQNYPFFYIVQYNALTSQQPLRFPDPTTGTFGTLENGLSPVNPTIVPPQGLSLISRSPFAQRTPYTETYNLTNQYEITHNDSIQLAYVGSVSRHLTDLTYSNAPNVMLAPGYSAVNPGGTSYVPFPDFATGSSMHATDGVGTYNSIQLTYEHRFSSGLQLLGNYTLDRCLSDAGPQETGSLDRARYLPGFGNRAEYTNCPQAATNIVHISGTYKLPYGPKMHWQGNRATNAVLGGWQLNGIYTLQSGNFFGVGCTQSAVGDFGCYSNVTGDPYAGKRTISQWMNPAAFSNPTPLTSSDYNPVTGVLNNQTDFALLGSSRAYQFVGPTWYNIDASLFKEFYFNEATYFQFRLEAFNALNHVQLGNPGNLNFIGNPNFAEITNTRNPGNDGRIVQLALKFYF